MPGIPREVAEDALHVVPGSEPTKQRLRRFDDKRHRAIGEEIAKLLVAGFIKEVYHSDWLANHVLVKNKNRKWRMCVDYTGLNKVCPKDHFPLPCIDQIVDSTSGCEILSFSGCLFRLPPDHDERVRSRRDFFHHLVWFVLLCNHAFRSEERWRYLSTVHVAMLRRPNQPAQPT